MAESIEHPVRGVVGRWSVEEGWGVIEAPEVPGGCWLHFSHLTGPGFRGMQPGEAVAFTYEVLPEGAEQDGHRFRALRADPLGGHPARARDAA